MEITIKDLKYLKLAPSLIYLLKCIHNKDNTYLIELNKVADIEKMSKFLEEKGIIKIINNEISYSSFVIRKLNIETYLSNKQDKDSLDKDIDEVINYFKFITGKTRISSKSSSNRKFIKARLIEYNIQDLKDVIKLKTNQWKNDKMMDAYLRISTIFNDEKFQGYIGELQSNKDQIKIMNVNKMI